MPDLLLEIGLEEIPARMIGVAQAELLRRTVSLLRRENLLDSQDEGLATSYSTPRRLAVLVPNVFAKQADSSAKVLGPSAKIAFKDGQPTPAAEAFARKNGLTVNALKIEATDKGDYVVAETATKGRSAAEVLGAELPKEIAALYWAKNMRWIPGSNEKFVRPVLWLACLLGDDIVPITFAGKTAGRASCGHRVLSSGEPFEIQSPQSYLAQLEGEFVLADVEARRHKIRKALDHVCRTAPGTRWREDHDLVDAVTHLTEWPDVLLGNFEPAYLTLPEEVLVTVMRDHQKYFAVEDATGKLASYFLTVTNIALDETNTPIIKQGNERVLRARFNDARFFWEFDQRIPLTERVKLLENVTFQKDLGSYAKKSERVRKIASELGRIAAMHGTLLDFAAIDEATLLAKTDLTTELVKEFTELQGIVGGLYAKSQNVGSAVADIIYDQYLPASMQDEVPRSLEGAVFGIADRADTIAGMFRLGMEPTGSKDPFALRRAANGIVKILAETAISLNIQDIITRSTDQIENGIAITSVKTADKMRTFFRERIEFYLREVRGFAYDVVAAVLSPRFDDVHDLIARADAVAVARGGEDFTAVCASYKRMKNILNQADFSLPGQTTPSIASEPVEVALQVKFDSVEAQVRAFSAKRMYGEALAAIATLRPEIDAFFEGVMVNDPDPVVRHRRLNQLHLIVYSFSGIADFSEIVTAG
jgi:glycyl-tRNA synthetase beta chain